MLSLYPTKKIVAGCDEAGRGCLCGPVVAAAVILPKDFQLEEINDSKQLTPAKRKKLVPIIKEQSVAYHIAFVDNQRIDEINILNASIEAMHFAVDGLSVCPELLIIDGNRFHPFRDIEHQCVVKGDAKFMSIAAASILAKEARDDYMKELHLQFPMYDWNKNMGYPTAFHRKAIQQYGDTPYHRKSFKY